MDLEKYAKKALEGKDTGALEALTRSEAGEKLLARFDGAAMEKAARSGDMNALSALLKTVLSTPEGREFAETVKKAAGGHGR